MILRHFTLPDGRILAWRETGSGPTLVLLHGWSLSGLAFGELAGHLQDFRLLLPDLPGHGGSSPAPSPSLATLADDLAVWLGAAVPGPLLLGGWSLGGMLAMELAARSAIPVERLLLIATTPRFTASADWPHGLPVTQVRALARNLARRFTATLGEFFALSFGPGEVDARRLRAIRAFAIQPAGLPDPASAAALLALLEHHDQRRLPAAITCPTLVIHGAEDRIVPVGAGRALAAALPQGRLCEFTATGHAPHWTRLPETAEAIREFCAWGR